MRPENIGIGRIGTWHGSPDMVARGCIIIKKKPLCESDNSDDSDTGSGSSKGRDVIIEGKKDIDLQANLSQFATTTIVASFTKSSLCPRDIN